MSTHAILAPSSAHRWMECLAAPTMEKGREGTSSYAAEGTLAHTFAAQALAMDEPEGNTFLQAQIDVEHVIDGHRVTLDEVAMEAVKVYVDAIRTYAEQATEAYVECALPVGLITGEVDAQGTGDSVLVLPDELQVHDLKFGKGVWVDAQRNKQLMLYAAAAYLGVLHSSKHIKRIRLFIHQPRIFPQPSEWECSIDTLLAFIEDAKISAGAAMAMYNGHAELEYSPSESACQFCKAKAICPALAQAVADVTTADFANLEQAELAKPPTTDNPALERMMLKVGLVEDWCKAVRAEVETQLLQGAPLEHFKLVQGRKGPRKWVDAVEVENLMKKWRMKQEEIYDRKLISPTTAERLMMKDRPKWWKQLMSRITQSEGQPHVAPMNDKRPAITASTDDFTNLTQ